MNRNSEYYKIPDEFWFRIHFVRPRFKGNIEEVLLYMATECCRIPKCSSKVYNKKYFEAIKMFRGNMTASKKTLDNWRTEIPALFAFYMENKKTGFTETSRMAKFLYENQDLTQFLRLFLLSFQFPGGHIKPQDLRDIIYNGIKFKPAKYIIQVLMEGNKILSKEETYKEMDITAEEATYCIFNDLRVTSNQTSPTDVAITILSNRKKKVKYYNPNDSQSLSLKGKPRTKGDMTRYAGDILDYMEIANLLEKKYGYYSLKPNEAKPLKIFEEDTTWFDGYDSLLEENCVENYKISEIEPSWFEYVNDSMRDDLFETDIHTILGHNDELEAMLYGRIKLLLDQDETTNKEKGNLGEALVCGHEKMRVKLNGYYDLVDKIIIVDSPAYHPGYDIESYEADGTDNIRYIEVKTTLTKHKIQAYDFHMTTHEWQVAKTIKEHYYVYRLLLSEEEKILYVFKDPVELDRNSSIETVPRNGMDISFSEKKFKPTELLIWKN